jgi:hypothetical protein
VAVGYYGSVYTSPDGVSWTERTSGTTERLYRVAYGKNIFVAVGWNGNIFTSPDGVSWAQQTSPTGNTLYGVSYGNGTFIAVGHNGTIITSTNGITWTKSTSGTTELLEGAGFGNNRFVAVGGNGAILQSGIVSSSPSENYTISGMVKDFGTSQGISGVTVTIKNESGTTITSPVTDASGNFTASLSLPGTYTVSATKTNYLMVSTPQVVSLDTSYTTASLTVYMQTTETSQSINLSKGWNFISLFAQPSKTAISSVLSGISSNVRIVWGFDNATQEWLKYKPTGTGNTLVAIESGKGYWIYMDEQGTLTISGISGSKTIALSESWNCIGYNGQDNTSVSTALQSINGKWFIVWGWEAGTWSAKHESMTSMPVATLSILSKGKAYWILIKPGMGTNWTQP